MLGQERRWSHAQMQPGLLRSTRPVARQTRDTVLAHSILLFLLQSLGTAMGDVYTLDGGKLSGRGVVVGSGFRVLPLEEAPVRFGAGQGQQVGVGRWTRGAMHGVTGCAAWLC